MLIISHTCKYVWKNWFILLLFLTHSKYHMIIEAKIDRCILFMGMPKHNLVREEFLYCLCSYEINFISNSSMSNNLEMFGHQLMVISHAAWCHFYHVFAIVIITILFIRHIWLIQEKIKILFWHEAIFCLINWCNL